MKNTEEISGAGAGEYGMPEEYQVQKSEFSGMGRETASEQSMDSEYAEMEEYPSLTEEAGQTSQREKRSNSGRKRMLMALCSSAMVVALAVAAIGPQRIQGYYKQTEQKYDTGYQIRTVGNVNECGLFTDGVRNWTLGEIAPDASYYPVNGVRMQDSVVLRGYNDGYSSWNGYIFENLDSVEDTLKAGKTELYVQAEISAPGYQFMLIDRVTTVTNNALVYYKGKCIGVIYLKHNKNMLEYTQEEFDKAYELGIVERADGYIFAAELLRHEPDYQEGMYAEALQNLRDTCTVTLLDPDASQRLVIGDSLQVSLRKNLFISGIENSVEAFSEDGGSAVSGRYASIYKWRSTDERNSYSAARIQIDLTLEHEDVTNQSYYHLAYAGASVIIPRPHIMKNTENVEENMWEGPLYDVIFPLEAREQHQVQTLFEEINGIKWRICIYQENVYCFCEEEPNMYLRLTGGGALLTSNIPLLNSDGTLSESFYDMISEFEKIK